MEGRLPMRNTGSPPNSPPLYSPTDKEIGGSLQRKSSTASNSSYRPYHARSGSNVSATSTDSVTSPTKVPPLKSMRPSMEKTRTGSITSIGSATSLSNLHGGLEGGVESVHTYKYHMIRGKWVTSRLRTILYFFICATTATVFGLMIPVYKLDYLPYKDEVSSPRMFRAGTWQEIPTEFIAQDGGSGHIGMQVRAWIPDIDLTGPWMIIVINLSAVFVFLVLWFVNIYRSARSYYVKFTANEKISLGILVVYGLAFGATAGYITHTFKLDNDDRDFYSFVCSRKGTAQEVIFKNKIYYDGDCHLLTGSWITLLVLCCLCFITILSFPANIIYHNMAKKTGYSRFENKIGLEAAAEDLQERRAAMRPRQPWKLPKWAKWGSRS